MIDQNFGETVLRIAALQAGLPEQETRRTISSALNRT